MSEELVSIVIPVYNVKAYLEQCVQSVVKQSYENLEIILVDDGSIDGSGDLCEDLSHQDSRIIVYHKENGGLSSARNYGMDRSNGKYLYFLDSDDYIEKDTIGTLMQEIQRKNLDFIAFCGQCFTDEEDSGVEVPVLNGAYKKTKQYDVCSGAELFIELKKNKEYYPAVPMHFYDAEFLKRHALSFKEGILHEDELFSILAYYYADRVGACSRNFYHRRMRSNSIMTEKVDLRNVNSCVEILNILEQMIVKNTNEHTERYTMICTGYAHCLWLLFIRYSSLSRKDKHAIENGYYDVLYKLKKNHFYDSEEIRTCYKKRVLGTLRNNKMLYDLFDNIRKAVR